MNTANFNPRSPHGERRESCWRRYPRGYISIHAPRTGSDQGLRKLQRRDIIISIHAPRTGSDGFRRRSDDRLVYFNPRSPHGERPHHVLNREPSSEFQSTLPARGATQLKMVNIQNRYFNPRSPHGERRTAFSPENLQALFQSTLPARGATILLPLCVSRRGISIHAPRTGSDIVASKADCTIRISIHAPRTGSDENKRKRRTAGKRFQSTLPARGATEPPHAH